MEISGNVVSGTHAACFVELEPISPQLPPPPPLSCSSCAGVPLPALAPSLHCNTTYALLSSHLFIHPSIYNKPLILHSGSQGLLEPFPSVMGIVSIQPTTPAVYFKLLIMSIYVVALNALGEQHFSIHESKSTKCFLGFCSRKNMGKSTKTMRAIRRANIKVKSGGEALRHRQRQDCARQSYSAK